MKRALVFGGAGFIGTHLVPRLKREGYWVRAVDQRPPRFEAGVADELVIGDLRDPGLCRSVIDRRFDEVYQLAADMGGAGYIFTGSNDSAILTNSGLVNLNVVQACAGAVGRLLFASSACVYPTRNQLTPDEPDCQEAHAYPASPDSEYGWEKLFAERVYLTFHAQAQLEVRIVRLHNIFGPLCAWRGGREKAPAALCRKVAEACDGGIVDVWGDGRQTRSFLYVDECIEGLRRIMRGDFPGPLNLGSEEMITIDNLALLIADVAGKSVELRHIAGPQGVRGRTSHNALIEERIGWRPTAPLRDGIEQTYAWVATQVRSAASSQRAPSEAAGG